jgi:hypothetical protein
MIEWKPQHLPWKVEPQIDGPPYPKEIPVPRVLDASNMVTPPYSRTLPPHAIGPLHYDSAEIVVTVNEKPYSPASYDRWQEWLDRKADRATQFEKDVGIAERRKSEDQRKRRVKGERRRVRAVIDIVNELYVETKFVTRCYQGADGVIRTVDEKQGNSLSFPEKITWAKILELNKREIKKRYKQKYGDIDKDLFINIIRKAAKMMETDSQQIRYWLYKYAYSEDSEAAQHEQMMNNLLLDPDYPTPDYRFPPEQLDPDYNPTGKNKNIKNCNLE